VLEGAQITNSTQINLDHYSPNVFSSFSEKNTSVPTKHSHTGTSMIATQQASAYIKLSIADDRQFFHEINLAVMITTAIPTYFRSIEKYPQQIFMQSYEPNYHAKPAVSRFFFHEFNPTVMIPAVIPTYLRPIKN
jgi:hypothetical protein